MIAGKLPWSFGFLDLDVITPLDDLVRRRPVWEALSDLFLDTELTQLDYQFVARRIMESGYSPIATRRILWDEVFPVIECNLRHPAGVWGGFSVDWLQDAILGPSTWRQTAKQQPWTAQVIGDAWKEVCRFLPAEFE